MKCLVTGATGFLGRAVTERLAGAHEVVAVGRRAPSGGIRQADLRDAAAFEALLREVRPDAAIHLAAYREPDFCEDHPEETRRLNVEPVRTLCRVLPPDAMLVAASTDYVFDGLRPPFVEESPRNPVNVYGLTKREAEDVALARPNSLVVRFPLLVGAGPSRAQSGFVAQIADALLDPKPQTLDDATIRRPTWIRDVAAAIAFLLERRAAGVVHVSGADAVTRYTGTLLGAGLLGVGTDHLRPSRTGVARRAARPPDSALATGRLRLMGGPAPTPFAEVLRVTFAELGLLPR
jgi:dTDP-4-dehydrorhamnose reductase